MKRGSLQRGNRVDEDEGMEDNSLYSGRETGTPVGLSVYLPVWLPFHCAKTPKNPEISLPKYSNI